MTLQISYWMLGWGLCSSKMIRASSLPHREQRSSVQEMQLSWDKSRQLNKPWSLIQEVGKMLCERAAACWSCPLTCRSLSEKACRRYHHPIWIRTGVGIAMGNYSYSSFRTITNKTNSISSATKNSYNKRLVNRPPQEFRVRKVWKLL